MNLVAVLNRVAPRRFNIICPTALLVSEGIEAPLLGKRAMCVSFVSLKNTPDLLEPSYYGSQDLIWLARVISV